MLVMKSKATGQRWSDWNQVLKLGDRQGPMLLGRDRETGTHAARGRDRETETHAAWYLTGA